jgi:hypothetical protein
MALSKRMFGKYKTALVNHGRSPLAPLEKGGTGIKVPLFKGDLAAFLFGVPPVGVASVLTETHAEETSA